ncbi:MAG: hypothetical protein NC213_08675 [Acetobacter sp.]|nr:hypothetical protein [Bacteroides sp.]MCM1341802.1 hypothetical protein [Acetobacter sp.]MCM1433144.1 hypothetical protein [Clostridiales bacterium]
MKKTFKRFLSVFLAVLMVITVIPMGVYAAETEETEVIQVSVLEESRDLYSKTYETSEDTNVVISAAVPLHYEEDGELKDIDNTLVKSETDSSILTNNANAYNVELPKKYTDDSEIKVDYDGNSVSFKLINDVKSSKGDIAETEKANVDETNAESVAYAESNMDKLSSSITYENIMPDTDFEYNVQPDALKENIILNKVPDENYNIQYELSVGNLKAVLNDDNSISLFDGDNEVFTIEAPYMIDANDVISENVTVVLEKAENGYVLTYTPNYSWLSSEDTVYPVTIDPTIKITSNNESIEDTFIDNEDIYAVNSSLDYVCVQNLNENDEKIAFFKINSLPDLGLSNSIIDASFNFTIISDVENDYENNNFLSLYTLINSSSENLSNNFIKSLSSYSFNNSNFKLNENVSDIISFYNKSPQQYSFNITNIVNEWNKNKNTPRVLAIKATETTEYVEIAANCYEDYSQIPYITVEYLTNSGINENYTYTSHNLDMAGISYINEFSGENILERTDFSSPSAIGDLTFYFGKNCNTPENKIFGNNASMNYYKTLTIDDNSLDNNANYIITNGDGTTIRLDSNYSVKNSVNENNQKERIVTYTDNDNNSILDVYNAAFVKSNDNSDNDIYVLTKHTIKKENSNENELQNVIINYNPSNYRITSISDDHYSYNFSYSNQKINRITQESLSTYDINSDNNYLSRKIIQDDITSTDATVKPIKQIYSRYSYTNNNLTSVTMGYNSKNFPTKNISYEWDENRITKAIDIFGNCYIYTYNDLDQVVKVQKFNKDNQEGEYLTFEYGINTTIISDGTNTYTEYFDNNGNLLSTIDQNGNAVFNQYENGLITQTSQIRNSSNYVADFYGFESSNDSFISLNSSSKVLDSDVKFNGDKSLKLTAQANKKATFDENISGLDKNTTYTVSMWVNQNSETNSNFELSNDAGITEDFEIIETIGDWQRYSCTLDTEDANSLEISLEINNKGSNSSSVIYLDNAYVQKSTTSTAINCIKNGEFTDSTDSWTAGSNASVVENSDTIATNDSNCLKLNGIYTDTNTVSQEVNLNNTKENDKYVFGAWVKAVNALPIKEGTNREFSVSVYPTYSDNNIVSEPLKTITYSTDNSYWQYIEEELILNSDSVNNFDKLNGLEIKINYNYQMGYALVDGISLLKDELYNIEYKYDKNENIEDVQIDGESILTDESNNESSEQEPSVTEENKTDSNNTPNVTYDYDEYGNLIKTVSSATINDVTESLLSKYTYGNKGSLLTSSLNRVGYSTKYGYDYFGNVAAVSDANQLFDEKGNPINYNTTYYQYDNFQNISSILNTFEQYSTGNDSDGNPIYKTATLNVKYTYTGSRLDKIETINLDNTDNSDSENTETGEITDGSNTEDEESNEFTETSTNSIYSFEYDSWGNLTKIFIEKSNKTKSNESVPYIQYEYDDNNYHQLNSVSYINGQKIQYTYDENNNLIHQKDSNNLGKDSLEYSYFYLDDGTCYAKKNLNSGVVETYSSNTTTLRDSDGNIIHSYSYDSNGNTIEQVGNNSIETYTNSENNGTNYITNINGSENVLFSKYDELGRISEEHFSVDSANGHISREYTYYKKEIKSDGENTTLYDDIVKGIENTYGESDTEFNSSELPRYITYYYVNSDEEKTKLYEYRYTYLPNENTFTYTLVKGGDTANAGQTQDEEGIQTRIVNYNSSNMVSFDLNLDASRYTNANTASNSSAEASKKSSFLESLGDFIISIGSAIGQVLNENTTNFAYDSNGNILIAENGSSGPVYFTYDEATSNSNISNCLTGIHFGENNEISISYDEIGNVNKVDLSNSSTMNFDGILDSVNLNWSRGNTLDSIYLKSRKFLGVTSANIKVLDYQYDDNNLRTHKTIDLGSQLSYLFGAQAIANAEIDYIWNGNKLVGENIDCSGSIFNEFSGDDQINEAGKFNLVILYDDNDNAYGLVVNKTEDAYGNEIADNNPEKTNVYYYLKDADNTITGLIDTEGNCVVSYSYNTFGAATADHAEGYKYLMLINPLAYKDYIYDYETGMYYLQSRYYAPFVGRFISADSLLDTGSGTAMCTNAYAYCENDPINNSDPTGMASIKRGTLATLLDIAFDILIPAAAGSVDVIGKSLKTIIGGTKTYAKVSKVINKLKTGVVPTVKGIYSKFHTAIRTAIWRATGYTISSALGNSISSGLNKIVNWITNSKFTEQVEIIFCLFSLGGWIALLIDATDGRLNGVCRLW